MIDKLAPQALGLTGTAAADTLPVRGLVPALGSDVGRFQLALNGPSAPLAVAAAPSVASSSSSLAVGAAASAGSSLPASSVASTAPSVAARAAQAGRRSVGDAILEAFRSTANNASAEWGQARQAIMSPSMTSTEMLQMQVKLINVSLQIDLIGKGVSKVTSNLEQTLKTQ